MIYLLAALAFLFVAVTQGPLVALGLSVLCIAIGLVTR